MNWDSYLGHTGHNYFLYEENGVLSILPWDYNLAFGTYALGTVSYTHLDVYKRQRQQRTLDACRKALEYAKGNPGLLDDLLKTKRLPIGQLADGSGVERKTLERHRKYMVALLLIYTNGYEIIRGHLKQVMKGVAVR